MGKRQAKGRRTGKKHGEKSAKKQGRGGVRPKNKLTLERIRADFGAFRLSRGWVLVTVFFGTPTLSRFWTGRKSGCWTLALKNAAIFNTFEELDRAVRRAGARISYRFDMDMRTIDEWG